MEKGNKQKTKDRKRGGRRGITATKDHSPSSRRVEDLNKAERIKGTGYEDIPKVEYASKV